MVRNERLGDALRSDGRSVEELAELVGVDPKTVQRWVAAGRTPHRSCRLRLACVLGLPVSLLWPDEAAPMTGTVELVGAYSTRREVSPATIRSLLDGSTRQIAILAYAALWLWDSVPGFGEALCQKSLQGVDVRVCLGDPDSHAVDLRGAEEGIGDGMAARCRMAMNYAAPLRDADPGALRLSGATLYSSVLRFDDDALVNMHLFGNPASESPMLHIRRSSDSGLFGKVMQSFDRVWAAAQPALVG